jgi:hypothetical protein
MRKYISFLISASMVFAAAFSFSVSAEAATCYVTNRGSGVLNAADEGANAWTAACNATTGINNPTSVGTAFYRATAGTTVLYRGGAYTINQTLTTNYNNNGTSEASRIIHKSYPGENPVWTITPTDVVAIYCDSQYVTFDGLTIRAGGFGAEGAIIKNGDWHQAHHMTVQNCDLQITSSNSGDNVDVIYCKGGPGYSDYAVIQNNILHGFSSSSQGGVFIGGNGGTGKLGIKILNNTIHTLAVGIYMKHASGDTSLSGGAEWAYNYLYNIGGDGGTIGEISYVNIHDNLFLCKVSMGQNGGGPKGNGSLFNHNTVTGSIEIYQDSGQISGWTFSNNIFKGGIGFRYDTASTWRYNLYGVGSTYGTNAISGTPVFVGSTAPLGYALASNSPGYTSGSDGKSLGANVILIETSVSNSGVNSISTPQNVRVLVP